MIERGDVVRDLHDVVERNAGRFVQLEEQEVRERRLGPLDLRGQHRLLADVGVEEERPVREQGRDAVEAADGEHRGLEGALALAVEGEGRDRRERGGHEGADRLAADTGHLVATGLASSHLAPARCSGTLNKRQDY